MKEIPLKMIDTKRLNSINPLQFYIRNHCKNERHTKKVKLTKMKDAKLLQFYIRDPLKINDTKKSNSKNQLQFSI